MSPRATCATCSDLRRRAWRIAERRFAPEQLGARESLFAVGNGYLGVRGAPEEGAPAHDAGVILNGFHETWPIVYPEDAYGLARTGQTIVNAHRRLDRPPVRRRRAVRPRDRAGRRASSACSTCAPACSRARSSGRPRAARRVLVRSRRLASLGDRHLVAIDYEVVALDAGVRIAISLRARDARAARRPRTTRAAARASPRRCSCRSRRARTATRAVLQLAHAQQRARAGVRHGAPIEAACRRDRRARARRATAPRSSCSPTSPPGEPLRLSKYVAYHWAPQAPARRPARARRAHARPGRRDGYDAIEARPRRARRGRSGAAATSSSRARPTSSRPCASTSSS